ncbi:MAG: hypothetical protein J5642_06250 [Bacteroidales bacterium]|nr:hypothetical protein [Bacteroidales bacterium]
MKKHLPFILLLAFFLPCKLSAQKYLSDYFEVEQEMVLSGQPEECTNGRVIACIDGNQFYFSGNSVKKTKKEGSAYIIYCMDIARGSLSHFTITLPPNSNAKAFDNKYWFYNLFVQEHRLLLTTQFSVFEFDITNKQNTKLIGEYKTTDGDFDFIAKGQVYGVTQHNDIGFMLRAKNDNNVMEELKAFPLEAPFLLQFGPNALITNQKEELYMLNTPEPELGKYDLSGNLLASLTLNVPEWKQMDEKYIMEMSDLPYGVDRAIEISNTCSNYFFPMMVMPVDENHFIITYHQGKDSLHSREIRTMLVCPNNDWSQSEQICLSTPYPKDHVIRDGDVPILITGISVRKTVCGEKRIVQIIRSSDKSPAHFTGRPFSEFTDYENTYYQKNKPKTLIRVLKLKDGASSSSVGQPKGLRFSDSEGKLFFPDQIPSDKAVFIINNQPQCHSCEEEMLSFFNTLKLHKNKLYIVEHDFQNPLLRQERMTTLKQKLHQPFGTLYLTGTEWDEFLKTLSYKAFPMLILYDKKTGDTQYLSGPDLYPDDLSVTSLRPETEKYIREFLK